MLSRIIANREARKVAREQDEIQRQRAAEHQQIANEEKDANEHGFQELKSLQQEMDIETFEDGCFEEYQVIFPPPFPPQQDEPEVTFAADDIMLPLVESMQELGLQVERSDLARHAVLSGYFEESLKSWHQRGAQPQSFIGKGLFTLLTQTSDISLAMSIFQTLKAYYKLIGKQGGDTTTRGSQAAVPSASSMIEAFIYNGYDRQRAAAQYQESKDEGVVQKMNGDHPVRSETLKLVLQSIATVCEYCGTCPASRSVAFPPQDTSRLVIIILHLFMDSASLQLVPYIIPACRELLAMYNDDIWKEECAVIAREVVSSLYPTKRMQTRLVKMMDLLETSRALQLQQTVACVMLQNLIPTQEREMAQQHSGNLDDVAKFLSNLPWWKDGKSLVVHNRDDFLITDVELLLILCDVLLWPHALEILNGRVHAAGPLLSSKFKQDWFNLLRDIRRNIKSLKLEYKSVQTLADRLDLRYQEVLDI